MDNKPVSKQEPADPFLPLETGTNSVSDLRQRAEAQFQNQPIHNENLTNVDYQHLVHELSVHQIELEMQNAELRQARNELESKLVYTNLFDFAPVGYLTMGRDGTIKQVNVTGERFLKEIRSHIVGARFGLFVTEIYRPVFNAFLKDVFSSESIQRCELILQKENYDPVWVYIEGIAAEGFQECRVTLSNISQIKQVEADLRDSEEKYSVIFNNEIYAIAIFDAQTLRYLDVNDAFCRLYGYTRAQILKGMTVLNFTAEDLATRESIHQSIREGSTFIPLRMHRKKDGTTFPVEIVRSLYIWQGRKVMFSLVHDISDRRQMELELLDLNTRLEQRVVERTLELQQANRALAEAQETERRALALELHDELGQVLNRVKLSLDLMPMLEGEESRKHFDLARELVRDLIGRIRQISLELRPSMLDEMGLQPSLEWLFDTYHQQTGSYVAYKGENLDQRFYPRLEIAVYRIIQEALSNIIHHGNKKEVEVEVGTIGQTLKIQIRDQGGGFDVQAALAKRTSTGLSGMRERARQLGGTLKIESTPGKGTTITAVLPLKSQTGPLSATPEK